MVAEAVILLAQCKESKGDSIFKDHFEIVQFLKEVVTVLCSENMLCDHRQAIWATLI